MKNVLSVIGSILIIAVIVLISFNDIVSAVFVSHEDIERDAWDRRNSNQKFWDGKYTCDIELLNYVNYSRVGPDTKRWGNTEMLIEYDTIQYIVLDSDTLFKTDFDYFPFESYKDIEFKTHDGREFEINISN